MYGLCVRFDLRDAAAATAFDQLVDEARPGIAGEPGTLLYLVHEVEGEPLSRVFYEIYKDRSAFEAHEDAAHTRRFLAEREGHLASLRVEFLTPTSGKGLPS